MTGIVCALDVEYKAIKKAFSEVRDEIIDGEAALAECAQAGVVILKTGIGKQCAQKYTHVLFQRFPSVRQVFSTGIAGALSPDVRLGDVVVGSAVIDYSVAGMQEFTTEDAEAWIIKIKEVCPEIIIHGGKILCSDRVVVNRTYKESLYEEFMPLCVEMESAGVLRACLAKTVPFLALKFISDYADETTVRTIVRQQFLAADALGRLLKKLFDR